MTIVSVTGKIDAAGVVFKHDGGDSWSVDVPDNTADGSYAAEIVATNDVGKTDTWTGFLYIYDSRPIFLDLKCGDRWLRCRFETPSLRAKRIDEIVNDMRCRRKCR